jgi:hypothetical protein
LNHQTKANLSKDRDAKPSGPRFLPDAFRDAFKDPKIAGLPWQMRAEQ